MSKKFKVIESSIQPNPKEAEIWAIPQPDGTRVLKQYNETTRTWEGGSAEGGSDDGVGLGQFLVRYADGGGGNRSFKFKQDMTWREFITTQYNTEGWYIGTHYPDDGGDPYDVIITQENSTAYVHQYYAISTGVYDEQPPTYIPESADSKIVNGETYIDASFGDF